MTISCDCHVTYILKDLSCALCSLDEGHVVVEGEFLGGVKDTPPLLSQVFRLKLFINIKKSEGSQEMHSTSVITIHFTFIHVHGTCACNLRSRWDLNYVFRILVDSSYR